MNIRFMPDLICQNDFMKSKFWIVVWCVSAMLPAWANSVLADGTRASGEGEAGAVFESKTGAGATFEGRVKLSDIPTEYPESTLKVEFDGGAQIHPKPGGGATVPEAHGEAKMSVISKETGEGSGFYVEVGPFGAIRFNRDLALDRAWDINLTGGVEGTLSYLSTKGYLRVAAELAAAMGSGETGASILPYLEFVAKGRLDGCIAIDPSKGGRNSVCFVPTLGARLGFVQTGISSGLGVDYEYRISDAAKPKNDSVRFRVGPTVEGIAAADLTGGHSAGKTMLTAGVLAF
jgi:hypothetical protein